LATVVNAIEQEAGMAVEEEPIVAPQRALMAAVAVTQDAALPPPVRSEPPRPPAPRAPAVDVVQKRLDFSPSDGPSTLDGRALLLELGIDLGGADGLDILAGPLRSALFDTSDPYSLENALAAKVARIGDATHDGVTVEGAHSIPAEAPLSLSPNTVQAAERAAAERLASAVLLEAATRESEAIRAEARAAVAEAESTTVSWALREAEPLRQSPDELYRALMDSVDALSSAEEGTAALTALQSTQAEAAAQRQALALAMQWSQQSEAASVAAHIAALQESTAREVAVATEAAHAELESVFAAQAASQGAVVADLAKKLSAAQFRADAVPNVSTAVPPAIRTSVIRTAAADDDSYGSASFNEYSEEFEAESNTSPAKGAFVRSGFPTVDGEIPDDVYAAEVAHGVLSPSSGDASAQLLNSSDSVPEDDELAVVLNARAAPHAIGRLAVPPAPSTTFRQRARAVLPRESELDAILEDTGLFYARASGTGPAEKESLEALLANFGESVRARLRADHAMLKSRESALRASTVAEIRLLDEQRALLEASGTASKAERSKLDAVAHLRQRVVMRFHILLAEIERTRADQRARQYKDMRIFQRQVSRLARNTRADASAAELVASLDRSLTNADASSSDSSSVDISVAPDTRNIDISSANKAIAALRAPTPSGPDTLQVLELMLRTVLSSVLAPNQPLNEAAKQTILAAQQQRALASAPIPLEPHLAAGRVSLDFPRPVSPSSTFSPSLSAGFSPAESTAIPSPLVKPTTPRTSNYLAASQSSVSSDYSEDFDEAVSASPRTGSPSALPAARAASSSPVPEQVADEVDVDKLLADLEATSDTESGRSATAAPTATAAQPVSDFVSRSTSAVSSIGRLVPGAIGQEDTYDIVITVSKSDGTASATSTADSAGANATALSPVVLPSGDVWMMTRDDIVSAVTEKLADTLVTGLTAEAINANAEENGAAAMPRPSTSAQNAPGVAFDGRHETLSSTPAADDDDLYDFGRTVTVVTVPAAKPAVALRELVIRHASPHALLQTPAQAWSEDAASYLNEVLTAALVSDDLRAAVLQIPVSADAAGVATASVRKESVRVHLPVNLYLQLERARAREARGPQDPAEIEALQIRNKLIFDVINEELAKIDDRHKHRLLAARAASEAGSVSEANALVAQLIETVREELRGTLIDMARNVDASAARSGGGALSARAAALARADVASGLIGGDEIDSRQEYDYIASLIADELAAELTGDAVSSVIDEVDEAPK
jgi:hypothetical protein